MMDFDPNAAPAPKTPKWASYVPDRKGKKFKVYTNRGHALNSVKGRPVWALYRWTNNEEWVEVTGYDLRDHTECDVCGIGFAFRDGWRQRYYSYEWVRDENGDVADPPTLLTMCGYECARKVK